VCRFANVLKSLGVKRGDRVAIYLPMVPEVAVAMLACARIGAPHTVVFGGFSADSLKDRINDNQAKVLITADGGYRRGALVPLKVNADEAVKDTPSVTHVVVLRRTGKDVEMKRGRDQWWHDLMKSAGDTCAPEAMDAEDPLYILYTSGTTGKPKGILHTTGGYLTQAYATTKWVFDLKDDDVFWCTADVGWVTGHSYVVYGPLALGVTEVMFEGAPDLLGDLREARRHRVLHGADGDPRVHEVGHGAAGEARPQKAAPARHRGRADQSRGVDLVSQEHRRRALPHRGHVVADGDGRDHDYPPPRNHENETRFRDRSLPRHRG